MNDTFSRATYKPDIQVEYPMLNRMDKTIALLEKRISDAERQSAHSEKLAVISIVIAVISLLASIAIGVWL